MTDPRHPDTELTAYVTGALLPDEQARVAAHLGACAECRRAAGDSQAVLATLATTVPAPPPVDWAGYRAALRARVHGLPRRGWRRPPVPAMLATGVAAAAVLLVVHGVGRRPVEQASIEETMLGARLPLLQQYRVVERLELLEDLDAIRQLEPAGTGSR